MENKMGKKDFQHIFLYMDDSGKISRYEDYAIFAGIVLSDSKQKSKFTNMYKSIINDIKCDYCQFDKNSCSNQCPEIKASSSITKSHRRRIMNFSKQFITFGTIIYNRNINYPDIINKPASKGRFTEYSQRRIIKNTIMYLIKEKLINPNKPVYLHVNIDEMPTKTNGYYTLREGMMEEFKYGIINFNYQKTFKPILFSDLEIDVLYKDSKYDPGIQMADFIANTIHREFVINGNWNIACNNIKNKLKINVILRLPD